MVILKIGRYKKENDRNEHISRNDEKGDEER